MPAPGPVPEASIEATDEGLAYVPPGWFVVNARAARWRERPARGFSLPLTGFTDEECETHFPQLGVGIFVLEPGEPVGMYHWEADVEDFFVLYGEPLLIVEGQERPLRQWDFVHCPPGTKHIIIGAGAGPSGILAMGVRSHVDHGCNGGGYTVDAAALRHHAGVEEETNDARVAYAHHEPTRATRYQAGWLP